MTVEQLEEAKKIQYDLKLAKEAFEITKRSISMDIAYCKGRRKFMDDYDCDFIRAIDLRWNSYKIELTIRQSFYLNNLFYRLERSDI